MSQEICVVYYSGFGHTKRVAEAVAAGADAHLLRIDDSGNLPVDGWDRLAKADAIVFGTPTYIAGVSWQFKRFIDESSKVWVAMGWKDKVAAAFTNSAGMNGDKAATLNALFAMTQQHGMLWVGLGLMPSTAKSAKRDDINYVASFSGLATTTPSDATPEEMSSGDLQTAHLFGRRVRATADRLLLVEQVDA